MFTPFIQQKFETRSGPAKATGEEESALTSEGYIKIGTIRASQPGKKGDAEVTQRLEAVILKKAAEAGGDVVRFSKVGASETVEVPRSRTHVKCISSHTVTTSNFSCRPNSNCYTDIRGSQQCNGSCGTTSRTREECAQWETEEVTVTKREKALVSEGTVWRRSIGGAGVVNRDLGVVQMSGV